jgi:hypothetical protein
MSDTRCIENGQEWPRRYTGAELKTIWKAAGVETVDPDLEENLQDVVIAFQWASYADPGSGALYRSSKERRDQLSYIITLCGAQAITEEIYKSLDELDAVTSQLLGPINRDNLRAIARAAYRARAELQSRGPDPGRSRRQFIYDHLILIFECATGLLPGRSVHDREQGRFTAFVRAALAPFRAEMGCEDDIKHALHKYKARLGKRENPIKEAKTSALSIR